LCFLERERDVARTSISTSQMAEFEEPRLQVRGAKGTWRMAYVRGPEGIIVSLAEHIG
jgi:hypothetical protein